MELISSTTEAIMESACSAAIGAGFSATCSALNNVGFSATVGEFHKVSSEVTISSLTIDEGCSPSIGGRGGGGVCSVAFKVKGSLPHPIAKSCFSATIKDV